MWKNYIDKRIYIMFFSPKGVYTRDAAMLRKSTCRHLGADDQIRRQLHVRDRMNTLFNVITDKCLMNIDYYIVVI